METTWGALMQDAKKAAEPVAEGQHSVKIIDCEATKSQTDKLMFKIKAEILDGPEAKRKLFGNLVLSPENSTALTMFFNNMENIGLGSDFFAQEPTPEQIANAMVGRLAAVMVKHRTWQGQVRGDIDRWVKPVGGGLGGGPLAPGTVTGPAATPLPTSSTPSPSATPSPTSPTVGATPQVGSGPKAPDAPPPLPI